MPTPTFQPPQGQQSTAQLQDWTIKLVRDLNYLLENLDTVNINRLDAKVIIAQTITAVMLNVSQLSAITADMGTITAGSITTNAEINIGTDARVGDNLYIGQATTSDKIINLNGAYIKSIFGSDSLGLYGAGIVSLTSLDTIVLSCLLGNVGVQSQNGTIADIVGSINTLNSSISSLTSAIAGKVNSGSSTSTAPTHDHGIPSGTLLAISGGGSVAWVPSGSHSHTV